MAEAFPAQKQWELAPRGPHNKPESEGAFSPRWFFPYGQLDQFQQMNHWAEVGVGQPGY
jgi:hypothetical protein